MASAASDPPTTPPAALDNWQSQQPGDDVMPALEAVRRLQQAIDDGNVSPLALLGQAMLHDERVINRVLQVANHQAGQQGVGTITTLGRAIALLGFAQVENFCITARLMETLLRDRCHSTDQQAQWQSELALGLHMAMQARLLLQDCDAGLREQAYLAALLHGLGEPIDSGLSPHAQQAIRLAARFCQAVTCSWQAPDTLAAISQIASFAGTSEGAAERRLRLCCHQTAELAELYGAGTLQVWLPRGYGLYTGSSTDTATAPITAAAGTGPDPALQLHLLHELASLVVEKPDFDLVLHTALEGIQRGLQMDRSLACLLDADDLILQPRFALGRDADVWTGHFAMPLANADNVFSQVIARGVTRWVGSPQMPLSHPLCTPRMLHITCGSECFIAPLQFGDRVIGILYADRYASRRALTEQDYRTFRQFALQVRMCLQMAMQMD